MTDITLGTAVSSSRSGSNAFLDRAMARMRVWRQRVRSRDDLARLSRRDLQDIGLSVAQADYEATKPFWMN